MNDQQLTTILSSGAVVTVLLALIHSVRSEISSLRNELRAETSSIRSELKAEISSLREEMRLGFTHISIRFDDMRDLWRAELRRVEDILDARLKHMEEDRQR
ncbi:MAG: hypothetical protein H7039_23885 [Bryobacteraceae bacterium]|nr:hypothetical protein [Bryobacteraceae bacterium]